MSWQKMPENPKTVEEMLKSLPKELQAVPRVLECLGMVHLCREMEFNEHIVRRMFIEFWESGQK